MKSLLQGVAHAKEKLTGTCVTGMEAASRSASTTATTITSTTTRGRSKSESDTSIYSDASSGRILEGVEEKEQGEDNDEDVDDDHEDDGTLVSDKNNDYVLNDSSDEEDKVGQLTDEHHQPTPQDDLYHDLYSDHRPMPMPGADDDDDDCDGRSNPPFRRRLSRHLSREFARRRSSLHENVPKTPAGWTVLLSTLAAAVVTYEVRLQRSLTCPPAVYGQIDREPLRSIYQTMTASVIDDPKKESILLRDIQPCLFVGTRGLVASTAAYLVGGPAHTEEHIHVRQILIMPQDGATIALDWELPLLENLPNPLLQQVLTREERQEQIFNGPIQQPVVLILHGINNDASFGYVRSLMRACTDRGWLAAGMNFRGCGGVELTTPRAYNGAYTGDIRGVVYHLSSRLAEGVPVFIVGNSLGANLVAKYLGEEGLNGTLPECVAGGVTLGNPMLLNTRKIDILFSPLMALGAKRIIIENWSVIRQMKETTYQKAIRDALLAVHLADFDKALAPIFARNEPIHPFAFRVGFQDAQHYYSDASSYRLTRHVSVPMLQLVAGDDFLVHWVFLAHLIYSVSNPNIIVVETKCGGHLGWQESPPKTSRNTNSGTILGTSWADVATTDFIAAVLKSYEHKRQAATTSECGSDATRQDDIARDHAASRATLDDVNYPFPHFDIPLAATRSRL